MIAFRYEHIGHGYRFWSHLKKKNPKDINWSTTAVSSIWTHQVGTRPNYVMMALNGKRMVEIEQNSFYF